MVRNNWESTDIEAMKLFAEKRESSTIPVSDRALARAIGVSAPRVADLFNFRHGTPTLREFIALCTVFSMKPSDTIDAAIDRARRADEQLADDITSNPDLYDLAANNDDNKELESETPRE